MKVCTKCKKEYPATTEYFTPNKTYKQGLFSWCKACVNNYSRKWKQENKEIATQATKNWRIKNKEKIRLTKILYKKRVRLATPKDLVIRKELILIKKNCPNGMTIDHIIPLQGKNVCGLNVPWNLQYLTRLENCKKGAK